jgi:hypothetical protein
MIPRGNESAPAGLEVPTRATPRDVRGDGRPLRATYDGPASLRNTRTVVYISLDSGQAHQYELRRSEVAPTRGETTPDPRTGRVLAHDADASPAENAQYAELVVNCLVATGTARVVPLLVTRTLLQQAQTERARARELEAECAALRQQLQTALNQPVRRSAR